MKDTLLPELKDPDARKAVIEAVLALFARWDVPEMYQASLLGMEIVSKLNRLELPQADSAVFERIGHLLAIERALVIRYPYQYQTRDEWVNCAQQELGYRVPLFIMVNQGLEGIKKVRQVLESVPEGWS